MRVQEAWRRNSSICRHHFDIILAMTTMTDTNDLKNRGTWFQRFLVAVFALLLAMLFYWLLGFIIDDLGNLQRPLFSDIEREFLSASLLETDQAIEKQIIATERAMEVEKTRQRLLRESTNSSQTTLSQLLDIQRLSLQQSRAALSPEEQAALAASERLFLENQRKDQELTEKIVGLHEALLELKDQERVSDEKLFDARIPVQAEYQRLIDRRNFRVAALKLSALTPLLLIAAWLFIRRRNSAYSPIVYAFGFAVLLKAFAVMHECFPDRYFKYILILSCIAVVSGALVYLIRALTKPSAGLLMKQYREAYETFFCPICRFPIRRGPLKFLFWNRRSIKSLQTTSTNEEDRPYTCPMCSTQLFETCSKCGATRHSLLPACMQCGDTKELTS